MKCRAEIEWFDPGQTGGCLRIGGPDFSWRRYDDYHQACSIKVTEDDMAIVKGWHGPITQDDWLAMEDCFKHEGLSGYVFERKTKTSKIHRHVTVFDPAKPTTLVAGERSGVLHMPKQITIDHASSPTGQQVLTLVVDGHSITSQVFRTPVTKTDDIAAELQAALDPLGVKLGVPVEGDSHFVDKIQDAVSSVQRNWRAQRDAGKQAEPATV